MKYLSINNFLGNIQIIGKETIPQYIDMGKIHPRKRVFLLHYFKAVLLSRYIIWDAYVINIFQGSTLKII